MGRGRLKCLADKRSNARQQALERKALVTPIRSGTYGRRDTQQLTCTKSLAFWVWTTGLELTGFRKMKKCHVVPQGARVNLSHTHTTRNLKDSVSWGFSFHVRFILLEKYDPKELSEMTEMLHVSQLCNKVATTHMGLLSTWNMPGVNEEMNFLLHFIFTNLVWLKDILLESTGLQHPSYCLHSILAHWCDKSPFLVTILLAATHILLAECLYTCQTT